MARFRITVRIQLFPDWAHDPKNQRPGQFGTRPTTYMAEDASGPVKKTSARLVGIDYGARLAVKKVDGGVRYVDHTRFGRTYHRKRSPRHEGCCDGVIAKAQCRTDTQIRDSFTRS